MWKRQLTQIGIAFAAPSSAAFRRHFADDGHLEEEAAAEVEDLPRRMEEGMDFWMMRRRWRPIETTG
jgi:hypothetical protein